MNNFSRFISRLIVSIFCIYCFPMVFLHAQISEGGLPPSFRFATDLRSIEQPIQIPVNFSIEDLKTVDAWRVSQGVPLAIAKLIDTDLNISNDGHWIT